MFGKRTTAGVLVAATLLSVLWGFIPVGAAGTPAGAQVGSITDVFADYISDPCTGITRIYVEFTYTGADKPTVQLTFYGKIYDMVMIRHTDTNEYYYEYNFLNLNPGTYPATITIKTQLTQYNVPQFDVIVKASSVENILADKEYHSVSNPYGNVRVFAWFLPEIPGVTYTNVRVVINGTIYYMQYDSLSGVYVYTHDFGYSDNKTYTYYFAVDYGSGTYSTASETFTNEDKSPSAYSIFPYVDLIYVPSKSGNGKVALNVFIGTKNYINSPPEFRYVLDDQPAVQLTTKLMDLQPNIQGGCSQSIDYREYLLYGPYLFTFDEGTTHNLTIGVKLSDGVWRDNDLISNQTLYNSPWSPELKVDTDYKYVSGTPTFTVNLTVTAAANTSSLFIFPTMSVKGTSTYGSDYLSAPIYEYTSSDEDFSDGKIYSTSVETEGNKVEGYITVYYMNRTSDGKIYFGYVKTANFYGALQPDVTGGKEVPIPENTWFVYNMTKPCCTTYGENACFLLNISVVGITLGFYEIAVDFYVWCGSKWVKGYFYPGSSSIAYNQYDDGSLFLYIMGENPNPRKHSISVLYNDTLKAGSSALKFLSTFLGANFSDYAMDTLFMVDSSYFNVTGDTAVADFRVGDIGYRYRIVTMYDGYLLKELNATLYAVNGDLRCGDKVGIFLVKSGSGALPSDPYPESSEEPGGGSEGLNIPGYTPWVLLPVMLASFAALVILSGRKRL